MTPIPSSLIRTDPEQWGPSDKERQVDSASAAFFIRLLFAPYSGRAFVDYRALYPCWTEEGVRGLDRDSELWSATHEMSFSPLSSAPGLIGLRVGRQGRSKECYFGVLPRSSPSGKIEAVGQAAWLWADIDAGSAAKAAKQLRAAMANGLPQPHLEVMSRNGIHCYWALQGVVDLPTPQSRRVFTAALRGLAAWLGSDMAVTNVNAILRIPGSHNLKVEGEPVRIDLSSTQLSLETHSLEWWKSEIPGYVEPEEYKPRERRLESVGREQVGFRTTRNGQALLDSPPATDRHKSLMTILSGAVYYNQGPDVLDSLAIEFAGKTGLPEAEALRLARHFDRRCSGH